VIGSHTVSLIPDPDANAWGPVLNSNPYMTTDIAGWTNYPTTQPWTWGAGGYAVGPPGVSGWLVRSETAPIPRGASTLFRVRFRFTVAQACRPAFGIFYGDTPLAAKNGPFWAGPDHCAMAETTLNIPTAGSYVAELTHDPSLIPPQFIYLAPEIHWGNGDNPVVDSVELWGQGSELIDLSCLVDTVTIHHGRDDTNSQPDAPSATIELSADVGSEEFPAGLDVGGIIRVVTDTPLISSTRFTGRVTDITQGWEAAGEDTPDRVTVQVIATGALAELGRRTVGDAPWGQELDGSRIARIMAAAGITLDPTTSDPGTVQILPRDVDSQPALDVAQAVAVSAGGIVWATRSGDIRYADANHRRGATSALDLDACDILVTPYWSRTTAGLINDVSIGYGVAAEGSDQPRYVAERADSKEAYGEYGFTTTTELAALADATAMGQLLLTRNRAPVWVMSALPVDVAGLDEAQTTALLALDMNDLTALTGLPAAGNSPTSAYLWVEGWSESLAYGVHELTLVVSGYCRTSPAPRWNDSDPNATWDGEGALTWDDATCLGPTPNRGRWDDVPATTRWNQMGLITWDNYRPGGLTNAR
jgi:hypothetical protein